MSLNGIKIERQNGGLGRRLQGRDHVSGLLIDGMNIAPLAVESLEELEDRGYTQTNATLLHYHVAEFFRLAPGAKLYIQGIATLDGTYSEISELQSFANGEIRQLGILRPQTAINNIITEVGNIQTEAEKMAALNLPLSVIVACKFQPTDLASLPNLHELNAPRVSIIIGEDGGGYGAFLRPTLTGSAVTCIGAAMGAIARAAVSSNIGWVATQNLVTSVYPKKITGGNVAAKELDVPALVDGTKISNLTIQQQNTLNDKGYIFIRKHIGSAGSFFNDSFTCDKLDSDFAYIENNRTIDKCQRGIYAALLSSVCSPVSTDPESGEITADSAAMLEALAGEPLEAMMGDGDLSGYSIKIDTKQPVLSTSKLEVIAKAVPKGVLRELTVKLGLAVTIA